MTQISFAEKRERDRQTDIKRKEKQIRTFRKRFKI